MNEKYLTLFLIALACLAVFFLPGAPLAAAEIITLKLMYVALLLAIVFGLIHVFRGTQWDFYKEVMMQHNIAGALFLGSIIIGIAMVIGK